MNTSQTEKIHQNKLKLLRRFLYLMIFSNFYYQIL